MTKPLRLLFVPLLILSGAQGAEPVEYARDVRPILARHCHACHGPQKQLAGLRLDSARNIREGGNSGTVIQPGKSQDSLMYKAVSGHKDVRLMPPKEPRLTR